MTATKNKLGFTLIELLVVVFIMGLVLGLAGLNFNRNLDSVALNEAKRFARVLSYTKEYSAYTGRILSLRLNKKENSYYFLYIDPVRKSWNRLDKDTGSELLRPHKVDKRVKIRKKNKKAATSTKLIDGTEDNNSKSKSANFEIALITPFSDFEPANLELSGETKTYIVSTDEYDDVQVENVQINAHKK